MTDPAASNDPGEITRDLPPSRAARLREVASLFVRLGFTAFGGPAAHVAMMEAEVVTRRRWLDRRRFLDLLAAINFIPGPNSTELAIQLGLLRAGRPGLVVAGACFIVPAVLIILPLAWLYVTYAAVQPRPEVRHALAGINACIVAVIVAALWRFAKTGIKDRFTAAVTVAATAVGFIAEPRIGWWLGRHVGTVLTHCSTWLLGHQPELLTLAAAGVAGAIWYARPRPRDLAAAAPMLLPPLHWAPAAVPAAFGGDLWAMTLFFLKVGATLFGSGYVLVSYLQGGLVDQHGWLTRQQLLDAIAVGQVTPGPLLTTATFVGFVLGYGRFGGGLTGGIVGALLATAGIFLPSFVFVAILGPVLARLRESRLMRGALDGMNAAVVAMILVVCVRLGATALSSPLHTGIAAVTLVALLAWNFNSTWLILAAAAVGWAAGMR